jgi:hypothetical protein
MSRSNNAVTEVMSESSIVMTLPFVSGANLRRQIVETIGEADEYSGKAMEHSWEQSKGECHGCSKRVFEMIVQVQVLRFTRPELIPKESLRAVGFNSDPTYVAL